MGVTAGTLTQQEIQDAFIQSQRIAASAGQVISSGQFIYFAAFDGTNNDRLDLPQSAQPTSVAQKKGTHLFLDNNGDCYAKKGESFGTKLPTPYSTERA